LLVTGGPFNSRRPVHPRTKGDAIASVESSYFKTDGELDSARDVPASRPYHVPFATFPVPVEGETAEPHVADIVDYHAIERGHPLRDGQRLNGGIVRALSIGQLEGTFARCVIHIGPGDSLEAPAAHGVVWPEATEGQAIDIEDPEIVAARRKET
jgi:hypothetical protein